MNVVIDASVAVKWVLREPGREAALRWLDRYEQARVALIAPTLLLTEVGGVLSKRRRRRELSEDQARRAFRMMEERSPALVDDRDYVAQAMELSLSHRIAIYDCLYLALAIEQGCEMVTADERFFAAVAGAYPFVRLLEREG